MSVEFSTEEIEAGEWLFAKPWMFLKGVVGLEHLPPADRPEIAFAGRSNVGKSSLINALVRNSGLARTSNTPGRTQELNFFTNAYARLFMVDMPGYGFAKAPKGKVDAWTGLVKDYLRGRQTLARTYLLIDSRHGIKAVDDEILELLDLAAVSYQIVLTKADKLNPYELADVLAATGEELAKHPAAFPVVLPTSSETGAGMPELRAAIAMVMKEHTAAR
jgi:GTP-binding protein